MVSGRRCRLLAVAAGPGGGLPARVKPELVQDALHVDAGGAGRDGQPLGELAVGVTAGGEQGRHLPLPGGKGAEGSGGVLQACATTPSMSFDIADSADLTTAFRAIGAQIGELRIAR